MLGACDLRAQAGAVRAPTAILVGEEDYATPVAMAEELHRLIGGSTLGVIPKARHLTPIDSPTQVAEAIGGVLDLVAVR
jgi:3-oxoadipate enol-lactonase